MKLTAAILAASLLVGATTWAFAPRPHIKPPLTYDTPVQAAQTSQGVVFTFSRCNNTNHDLAVSVTAFWESDRIGDQPVPFQPVASGIATVNPGCSERVSTNPTRVDYLPSGRWRGRGSVCIIEGPCTGWYTDFVDVP